MNKIRKYLILKLLLLIGSYPCLCQNLKNYYILSSTYHCAKIQSLSQVNLIEAPTVNTDSMVAVLDTLGAHVGELCTGKGIPCDIDLLAMATRDSLDIGTLYRLRFVMPGAVGVQFIFDQFHLATGSLLDFYNPSKTISYGAFTDSNNIPSNAFTTPNIPCIIANDTIENDTTAGNLVTKIVQPSDTIIIEYFVPKDSSIAMYSSLKPGSIQINESQLHINTIIENYKDFTTITPDLLSCEVNVTCAQGDPWINERSSIALINVYCTYLGATGMGTAALINDVPQDGTPYLMTANHIFQYSSLADIQNTTTCYFHDESMNCTDQSNITNIGYTASGCSIIASGTASASSDYELLLLNSLPANADLCFEGWDYSSLDLYTNEVMTSLHHPLGDNMKISTGTIDANQNLPNFIISDYYNTYPSNPSGTYGSIEEGSSGCPLFDANGCSHGQCWAGVGPLDASCHQQVYFGSMATTFLDPAVNQALDPGATGNISAPIYCPGTPWTNPFSEGTGDPCGNWQSSDASLGSGIKLNDQSANTIVYICSGSSLILSPCLQFPNVYEPDYVNCPGWKKLLQLCPWDWYMQYFTRFQLCDNNLNPIGGSNTHNYNILEPRNATDFGQQSPGQYNVFQYASDAGLTLTPGVFWQFTIGGNYVPGLEPNSQSTWYIYIIPTDNTISNTNLNQQYKAINNLTLQNDVVNSGVTASAIAGGSIDILPSTETDIKAGSHFIADIDPNVCIDENTPGSIKQYTTTLLSLPSDFKKTSYPDISSPTVLSISDIGIMPNPSTGLYTVRLDTANTFKIIYVSDVLGNIVYKNTSFTGYDLSINLQSLSSGIYILKGEDINGRVYEKKLVKE